jgi:hypothetical protein
MISEVTGPRPCFVPVSVLIFQYQGWSFLFWLTVVPYPFPRPASLPQPRNLQHGFFSLAFIKPHLNISQLLSTPVTESYTAKACRFHRPASFINPFIVLILC